MQLPLEENKTRCTLPYTTSGISKLGRRRDPSYRIITGQGPGSLGKEVSKKGDLNKKEI